METATTPTSTPRFPGWAPLPGSQVLFLTCPIYEALYEGTRGPGKTDALIMDFAQHVARGYGQHWRGILFRQTYKQLADIQAKTMRWFTQIFDGSAPERPRAVFNSSNFVWRWATGETLFLRQMERPVDYWNYHGHEYPWIGWEELTNWPTSECYDSMFACSRSSYPGIPRKYRATCNPYGVGHNWVKARFIDPAPRGTVIRENNRPARIAIHGSVMENRYLLEADPDYITRLASIDDPNKRNAWLHGSWDITSGGMIDDIWKAEVHCVAPFRIPESWKIDRAFDWGSSRPFSVGWWAESNGEDAIMADGTRRSFPPGTIFRIAEWYGWTGKENEGLRMLAKDIAAGILDREHAMFPGRYIAPGPADTSIFDIENGRCIADDMADVGCYFEPADKSPGSRKQGAERIRTMLGNALNKEGPGLYVFSTCRQWLRTVPVIPRSEKDPDDVDTNVEDHAWDETRYRAWSSERAVYRVSIGGV